MANPYVAEYQNSLYWNNTQEQSYRGADKRSALEILGGVKCFVTPKGEKGPGVFREKESYTVNEKEFTIWESGKKIPLLFAYDQYMSRDEFEQLDIEQKQQALLESVVLEQSENTGDLKKASFMPNDAEEAETVWTPAGKIELEENVIHVKERDAGLKIQADIPEAGEVYLILEGIEYEDDSVSGISRTNTNIRINVTRGNLNKSIIFKNKDGFGGTNRKNNFLCNLEMNEPGMQEIELKFQYTGTYRFKNIRIAVQPVEKIIQNTAGSEDGVEGYVLADGNEVRASLDLAEPRTVCLAVPFDKGWKAFVDGKEADLMRANIMYMALPLEAGEHEIELRYSNSFIRIGAIVSAMGILGILICLKGSNRVGDK